MITAPLAVLWYDRVFVAPSWREIAGRRTWFFCGLFSTWGVLAFLMLYHAACYPESGVLLVQGVSPWQYAVSQPGILLHYLTLAFWPAGLCLDYAWPIARTASEIVPSLLALATLAAVTAWAIVRRPMIGFLAGLFFLILAPTSSFAPVRDLANEHRMYLPLAPIAILTVLGAAAIWRAVMAKVERKSAPLARVLPTLAAGALATALGWRTVVRNENYRSELSIWQNTLEQRPNNLRARCSLAGEWMKLGHPREAIHELDLAIQRQPEFTEGFFNRGCAYQDLGEYVEAIRDYSRAIALSSGNAMFYNNRGRCYERIDKPSSALADYNRAIQISPNLVEALYNRGRYYQSIARHDEAIVDLTRVIERRPALAEAFTRRGVSYVQVGRMSEGAADFTRAIELKPDFATPYLYRAGYYFSVEHAYERAWADTRRARELGGQPDPNFIRELESVSGHAE